MPVDPTSDSQSESRPEPGASRHLAPESVYPQPGHRWGQDYFVEAALSDPTGAAAWRAIHLPSGRALQLRLFRSADPFHEQAWQLLERINCPRLLRALGARKSGDQRVELFDLPPGRTLRAWRAEQASITLQQLTSFLGDILEALEALHGAGLVHGHIDPDSFCVDEAGTKPHLVLGHLERAAQFHRGDLLPIAGDPFYTPPEAAGLYRHQGGEGLLAWDWWSIGRVLQELVLGRHLCELVIGRPLNRSGLTEREYAEGFLLEKTSGTFRSGGVEAMQGIDQRTDLLLRGLLTSAREARWGAHEVRAWLAGESPRERYSLGRNERVFRWRGQPYTVREAADVLRSAENWEAAYGQILGTSDPTTLSAFIREVQGLRPIAQKLDATLKILNDPELQDFPREAVEEMVLALALNELAGNHLVWRGRRVDAGILRDTLRNEDGSGHKLACVWTLTSVPMIAALEKTDSEVVRILLDASHLAKRALDRAWKYGWLAQNDIKGIARVWELAFSPPSLWHEARTELRRLYACSTVEEVDQIFQNDRPGNDEALLLAVLAPNAHRRGFVTHEEWERRQYATLATRGRRLSEVLFWKRLGRVLRAGPWCLGHLLWFALGWTAVGLLIAIGWPGPHFVVIAFLPGLVAVGIRLVLVALLRRELAHSSPGTTWHFSDGPARCESATAATHEHTASSVELEEDLLDVNAQIAGLTRLKPQSARVPEPPALRKLWTFAWFSWALWIGIVGLCGWRFHVHRPTLHEFTVAWTSSGQNEASAETRSVKQPWPFTAPDYVRTIAASDSRSASSADLAAARRAGRSFTSSYLRSSISAPVLVSIPSDQGYAFMIFDGKRDEVANSTVYYLPYLPEHGAWMELDGHEVMTP